LVSQTPIFAFIQSFFGLLLKFSAKRKAAPGVVPYLKPQRSRDLASRTGLWGPE
jgi:hypothetical protein